MFDGTYRFRRVGFLAGLVLLAPLSVSAQTTTGTIEGLVRDQSGATLPGVQITANSPALIQKDLTVESDQDGFYRLPLLPPGAYAVTYLLDGFQSVTRTELLVTAGRATVVSIDLKVAGLEESVTVVGASPMIDPTDAKVSFT